ncbi:thrombospondin type-1 domain-containing protein 4 [Elysia marginata]|uniref:Thrombospondin type-1 domain-containing protein 4 n=1 Tax=Elysia marginata TaxID=1093978 RepID=A0AAV4EH66_9GAST|nr:thrombospondin type-1 domain-containing protein 4 [Elysia marginata]
MSLSKLLLISLGTILVFTVNIPFASTQSRSVWGPWTGWSVCSETCGHGTAYRIRTCHSRARDGSTLCEGQSKQYRICIRQSCLDKSKDYRWRECSKHNRLSYGGKRYTWVPYINDAAPCELSCKSVGYSYYARFNRSVADGVICNKENTAMCMGGKCIESGCDGILRSGAVPDRCGVCNGDDTTCELFKGIFTRTHLTHRGYNIVTNIPAGARSINITELRRSRNYLALSTPSGYFLNGQMRLRSTGTVHGAGTTFTYSRSSGKYCPGDCLTGPGPLNTSLRVELIYFGRNPGIMYEYTVPRDSIKDRSRVRTPQGSASSPSTRDPTPSRPGDAGAHSENRIRVVSRVSPAATDGNGRRSRDQRLGRTAAVQGDASTTRPRDYSRRRYRDGADKRNRQRKTSNATRSITSPQQDSKKSRLQAKENGGNAQYKHYYHTNEHDGLGDVPMVQSSRRNDRSRDTGIKASIRLRQRPSYVNSDAAYRDRYAEFRSRTQYKPRSPSSPRSTSSFPKVIRNNNVIPAPTRNRVQPLPRASGRYGNRLDNRSNRRRNRLTGYRNDYGLYRWKISGFTPCSESCGGGFQQTRVVCVKSDSQVEVIKENCNPALTPEVTTVACNTKPCKPSWTVSDWSPCSVTCDRGLQKRSVECKQRISSRLTIKVSSSNCPRLRPPYRQYCQMDPCFRWRVSNWGECSTQCGFGQRTRTVTCVDGDGSKVSERLCRQLKPETEEICDKGSCAQGWFHSKWSKECSAECGRGFYTRQVYCSASDGSSLNEQKCGGSKSKPRERKRCKAPKPCGGQWYAGAWSACNASCGSDAMRHRDVLCIKRHGKRVNQVVKEHNCDLDKKPLVKQSCGPLPACEPQWFVMGWSKCSKSCGTGIRTREVKCVDASFTPSADCAKDKKPSRRQPCNTQPCEVVSDKPAVEDSSSDQPSSKNSTTTSSYSSEPEKKANTSSSSSGNNGNISTASSSGNQELQRDDSAQSRKKEDADKRKEPAQSKEKSGCQDKRGDRWCLVAKQARLCRYSVYRNLCCKTCGSPLHNPH